ncbi:enterobactin synthetase component F [Salmonella enterica subsp. enterica]|nr:enterobactin synthetase component F [Salmonella enterica subsp. enterica]
MAPYYLLGYSLGGTLAQGDRRPVVRARRNRGVFGVTGHLAAGNAKTGGKKRRMGLNPDVLAEIERERAAFVAAQQGNASDALFTAIEGNYADAVRLLTTAHSVPS